MHAKGLPTLLAAATLGCCGCGGFDDGAAEDSAPVPAEPTLVFVSDRDNPPPEDEDLFGGPVRWELYVQTLGRPPKRLTENATFDAMPACASDGRRLAYASGTAGGGIFVMNADGSGRRRLTRGNDYQPTWSPEGGRLAFTRQGPDERTRLYLVGSDGGEARPLLAARDVAWPAWSPRGDRIAFLRAPDPDDVDFDLFVTGLDGQGTRRLFRRVSGGQISWSPDGDEVAVTRNVGGLTRIWIVDVETREARKLTRVGLENPQDGPAWSPSGDLIAFGETAGLALARPDGSGYRQLRSGPAQFGHGGGWVTYTQPAWCSG